MHHYVTTVVQCQLMPDSPLGRTEPTLKSVGALITCNVDAASCQAQMQYFSLFQHDTMLACWMLWVQSRAGRTLHPYSWVSACWHDCCCALHLLYACKETSDGVPSGLMSTAEEYSAVKNIWWKSARSRLSGGLKDS